MEFKSLKHTFSNGEVIELDADLATDLLDQAKGKDNKFLDKLIKDVVKSAKG